MIPLLFAADAAVAIAPAVGTPPDPLAAQYEVPRATEVGTTAGQVRIFGLAGGAYGVAGSLAGQGTVELMTIPWIGVRSSSTLTIPFARDPQLWSFRVGPSLHFLPYHRVDFSLFFEGGFALVDVTKDARTVMPAIASGGSLDVALTSYVVFRIEGLAHLGIADRSGVAQDYAHAVGLLGLGLML